MLETIDPHRKVEKEAYREWYPRLKGELLALQHAVHEKKVPAIVVFEGFTMAGKGDAIAQFGEALDPRGFMVHSTRLPSEEEQRRHWLWRFWVRMPPRGKIGIFEKSWYTRVLEERVEGHVSASEADHAFQEINQLEELLAADGTIIVKYWLHLSKKEQARRLKDAEKDPIRKYEVGKAEWRENRRHSRYVDAAEEMIERTNSHHAPWVIVEAGDDRYRRLRIVETLCDAMSKGLSRARPAAAAPPGGQNGKVHVPALEAMPTVLDKVDLGKKLGEKAYEKAKLPLTVRLRRNQVKMIGSDRNLVIVVEGWDAAGKGGTIRRLCSSFDPRYYDVIPISRPTPEEKAQHYLWRFWRKIPKAGHITVYDRSWYGRVIVERVEGFCTEEEWRRAYQEINEFELQLYRSGTTVVKLWLHISPEEQLKRFNARQLDPFRQWKITDEDWRNREKWDLHRDAVDEMIHRTSTSYAPWTIVEAECKRHGRIKAMETVAEAMEGR